MCARIILGLFLEVAQLKILVQVIYSYRGPNLGPNTENYQAGQFLRIHSLPAHADFSWTARLTALKLLEPSGTPAAMARHQFLCECL